MEKEVEVKGKKFLLKELKYLDVVELGGLTDRRKHALKLLELSGIKEDEANNLTTNEGLEIIKAINELNGSDSDFQQALRKEEVN